MASVQERYSDALLYQTRDLKIFLVVLEDPDRVLRTDGIGKLDGDIGV